MILEYHCRPSFFHCRHSTSTTPTLVVVVLLHTTFAALTLKTMAPLSSLLTITLAAGSATAFAPASNTRPATKLYENFGFDFAEDQVENTPQIILGEANYKTWLNGVDPDNFMNRQVS